MKSAFDDKAKEWDTPQKIDRAQKIATAILSQIPLTPLKKVFEYGAGTGLLSFALKEHFKEITLADISEGMLSVLREKIESQDQEKKMKVQNLDLTREEAPREKYDLVYTMMTLHHIKDIPAILKKFETLLPRGGYLCIADLDKEDGTFHGKEVTRVHRGFDRGELQEAVQKSGFNHVKFSTVYRLEHENNHGVKGIYPIFLMTAQKV